MKKFSFLFALTLLASAIAVSPVKAQDDKQAEFERVWYDTCFTKKDKDKCYQLSKELIATYPKSTYIPNATTIVKTRDDIETYNKANEKFQAALKAYYSAPDGNKLDQLFSAGEEFLKIVPNNHFVVGQMALAGAHGSIGQIYKNFDKVKGYGENALKLFESTTPAENWKQEDWNNLRDIVQAQINQFLGFRLIETKGDKTEAVGFLTKSTMVKGKEGAGWKDPNNYWLRVTIFQEEYQAIRSEYDNLPSDEAKTGEQGKAILAKAFAVMDEKLIPDYARVMATATKPETKSLQDAAKGFLDAYWNYRTKAPEKSAEFVKAFSADPTVASPTIPVKVEENDPATLQAPTGPAAGTVKLSSGGAPGAGGKSANGNGKAATTTKGKAAPKATPKKRNK
ncbi:MAG: hypothetical protein SF097_02720 [Acidobacteriota bacterium]|nr:hypothetical protein [Acidobacteriota bacterium]